MNNNNSINKLIDSICDNPNDWNTQNAIKIVAIAIRDTRVEILNLKSEIHSLRNHLIIALITIIGSIFASTLIALVK